jgi:hypothetical protein
LAGRGQEPLGPDRLEGPQEVLIANPQLAQRLDVVGGQLSKQDQTARQRVRSLALG